jgi:hypothetical protein
MFTVYPSCCWSVGVLLIVVGAGTGLPAQEG